MRRGLLVTIGLAAMCVSGGVAAEEPGFDQRIRYVRYDADEVVSLDTAVGVAVHIVLEKGEKYVAHAFGDGKAWDFRVKEQHCFLKATAPQAEGNLTIVTDRRSYHFALKLASGGTPPTYEVVFEYPSSRAQRAKEDELAEAWGKAPAKVNLQYSMSGDLDIAPVNAWDNGEFTYFKFPGQRDIPAIYMVDVDGAESIVNRHSTGAANDLVVVHKVAARWVLRLGARALAVWNDAYEPFGRRNATGTASPDVNRVLWR